jgi:transcriptional regulator with XRE-family HTH domain
MKNKLKRQRRMLGLTQHALARKANIPPGRISWAETGRAKLTPDEVERVKQVLSRRAQEVAQAVSAA